MYKIINKKLIVVWICHFSNESVREKLPLSKLRFFNFLKSVSGRKKTVYKDYAPWVNNLIKEFEKFENIELHVIAPHKGLKLFKYVFEMNGIYYHFFKPELSFPFNKLEYKIYEAQKRDYSRNRALVKYFINQIQPDIVNLIGAENPYYSISALDVENIPVYLSAQTVYSNPKREKFVGKVDQLRWDAELKIHKKIKYFGCGGRMHRDLILHNNPDAIIFKNFFPLEQPSLVQEVPKEFDFVFFAAAVAPKKGIEDALNALQIVKKEKSDVTLNVVGSCTPEYKDFLNKKIFELGLENNIIFNDYFPVHADMHQHVKKSRFALLPIKLDVISGTVIEAILLDLPVVTYKTTGTPYLNRESECILISDIGDIKALANNMLRLLNSTELSDRLRINAKAYVTKVFDNTTTAKRLVDDYHAIINHYHNGTPIPEELLFDINEFPIY